MKIIQLRSTDGTGTLSYLLIDGQSNTGVIIDPNASDVDVIIAEVARLGVTISHIIDTHTHADHVSGSGALRERLHALVVMHEKTKDKVKILELADKIGIGETVRANVSMPVDLYVHGGETLRVGDAAMKTIYTPGHTDNHLSLSVDDALFTGDLLLAGQAGRSDLPGGNPSEQYDSLFNIVLKFPDKTKIYPGHDYADNVYVLLGEEKRTNPFLQSRTREEYIAFVKDFFPPITENAANGHVTLQCGVARVMTNNEPFTLVSGQALAALIDSGTPLVLLDVREPSELAASGAISGAQNISVRNLSLRVAELPTDKGTHIVTICKSGARSQEAAHFLATQCAYTNVFNLEGGMIAWTRAGLPVERVTPELQRS